MENNPEMVGFDDFQVSCAGYRSSTTKKLKKVSFEYK
jgi:hypothetical protein